MGSNPKDSGLEDDLDDAERARLHASLERSREDIRAGRVHDAMDVLAKLQTLRSQIELGTASLDRGEGVVVEDRDLDRYMAQLGRKTSPR
jgi:hypothetical protein